MKLINQTIVIFGSTGLLGKTLISRLYKKNKLIIFLWWSKTLDELMYFRSLEEDSPSIHHIIKNRIPSLNLKNTIDKFWNEPQFEKQKIKLMENEGILVNYKDINQIILALKK